MLLSAGRAALLIVCFPMVLCAQMEPNFMYVPGLVDTPLLYRKGQARISLSSAATINTIDWDPGPVFGGEVRGAYAIGDRLALVAGGHAYRLDRTEPSFTFSGGTLTIGESRYQGRWDHWEFGAGTFKLLPRNWIGEVYATAGLGSVRNELPTGHWMRAVTTSLSVQPVIGRANGFFEFAFASRIRVFQLSSFQGTYDAGGGLAAFDLELAHQGPFLMWEPQVMVRGGWRRVRITFQAGFSGDILGTTPTRADLTVGLGACIWLPGRPNGDAPRPQEGP